MAGEFTKLNIGDRELIKPCMEEYLLNNCGDFSMGEIKNIGNIVRYFFTVGKEELYLDFYFNGDGKTTINPSSGKNSELKVKIAEYLKKELTSVVDTKNTLTIRDIGEVEFTELIELMSKDDLIKFESIVLKESTNEYVKSMYVIVGEQGDKVTITYYNSGTLLVQGKPLKVFNELVVLLSSLFIASDEIVEVFNITYKTKVDNSDVEKQYKELLSNCYDKLPDAMVLMLKQSIYYTLSTDEMYEYTSLIHPILRVIEGHIKYIAKEKNLSMNGNIGSLFVYNSSAGYHYLRDASLVNNEIKEHLEKQYFFCKEVRNKYFHWDDLETNVDTTEVIDSRISANQIIFDKIEDINYYYTIC